MVAVLVGNHYEVLGIDARATPEQVERAYRFCLEMYGDASVAIYSLLEPEEQRRARSRVQEAYEVLRDPFRRHDYDVSQGFARPGAPMPSPPRSPAAGLRGTLLPPPPAPGGPPPASIIACADLRSRTPPAAFTPISGPTTRRISATSAAVAPPGPKPVEVLTKSAPAARAITHAFTFSSSASRAASMITFTIAPPARLDAPTPAMSLSVHRLSC